MSVGGERSGLAEENPPQGVGLHAGEAIYGDPESPHAGLTQDQPQEEGAAAQVELGSTVPDHDTLE